MSEKWASQVGEPSSMANPINKGSFFDIITKMDETVEEKVPRETFGTGLKRLAIFFALIGILLGVFLQIIAFIPIIGQAISGLLIVPIITAPIIVVVLGIVLSIIVSAFIFIGAKLVGGHGSFGNQFGASTLILWPMTALGIAMFVFYMLMLLIPIIGLLALIPVFFLSTLIQYLSTYFLIIFIKKVHGLSTFGSIMGTAIGMAIMVIIVLILAAAFFVAFIGALTQNLGGTTGLLGLS